MARYLASQSPSAYLSFIFASVSRMVGTRDCGALDLGILIESIVDIQQSDVQKHFSKLFAVYQSYAAFSASATARGLKPSADEITQVA